MPRLSKTHEAYQNGFVNGKEVGRRQGEEEARRKFEQDEARKLHVKSEQAKIQLALSYASVFEAIARSATMLYDIGGFPKA